MPGSIDLIVPTLTTPGPNYAQQINQDLGQVASHTHDGVDAGASIDIANQLCNEDLDIESHNLTNVRSVDLNDNPTVLTGTQDVNCLCVVNNVLGFNNSDGNFIPIVNSGGVVVPNLGFTNWTPRSAVVTANFSVLYTDTYNLVNINSAGGAITGTLPIAAAIVSPGANPSPIGRLYLFKDVSGHAGTNAITIQVAPASGNTFANTASTTTININNNFGYVAIYTDGINTWFVWDADVLNNEILALNESLLQIKNTSQIDVDNTSAVVVSGGVYSQSGGLYQQSASTISVVGCTATCSGGTQAMTGSCAWTFQSTSVCTFASGSTLTVNGTLQGTTTGGSFTIASTLNVSGSLNLNSGSTTSAAGQLNLGGTTTLSGVVNGAATFSSLSITGDSLTVTSDVNSLISNAGKTVISGELLATNSSISSGTYTCDPSGSYDRVLALALTPSSNITINLPATRDVGRIITILDGTGADPTVAPGYSVTINGNGGNFPNFTDAPGTTVPPVSSIQLQSAGQLYPPSSGGPFGVQGAGWFITFLWSGSLWSIIGQSPNILFTT